MKKRSIYQLRADLDRINLEGKSLRQTQQTVAKQYEKQSRAVPKKLQEGRATKRDMQKYLMTLKNSLDKKIEKREAYDNKKLINALDELNRVQLQRRNMIKKELQGYASEFVEGFLNGKVAVLGRGISTSMISTKPYTLDRILKIADNNRSTPISTINRLTESYRDDLRNIKDENYEKYIIDSFKDIMERAGYNLSDRNIKEIKQKLRYVDWLGATKLIKAIEGKAEKLTYDAYLGVWDLDDNRKLMETIFDDIQRASHNRMIQYVRTID